jgi:glutathione reductase (NADPH)
MAHAYDLIVIGSGTAAQVASHRMAAAGWKVAVIDHRPFGGTCALRGCDPKRMLLTGAQIMDDIVRMNGRGVIAPDARLGWRDLMAFKRSFTGPISGKQEQRYRESGIDAFHERARFAARDTVELAGGKPLQARHILLATGARPRPLSFPGTEHLISNEEFLELDVLPSRIVLVGGGYIAAELSHVAAHAGAKVTVLQRRDRLLPHFDPDLVGWLMESFRRAGIEVRTEHTVSSVEKKASGFIVRARTKTGEESFEADMVVHAAGRTPDLDALNLGAAEIDRDERGHLKLNEFLQSVSNAAVYAAGDAAAMGPPLTPVSSHDAKVVSRNLLGGNNHRPDYRGVPSVAFTIPSIAAVGMSEEQVVKSGIKCRTRTERTSNWYTARRVAEPVYGFKVMVAEDTDRILGAHVVGPGAEEVINLFGLAIRHELTASDLKTTMFAYPTSASDIGYML